MGCGSGVLLVLEVISTMYSGSDEVVGTGRAPPVKYLPTPVSRDDEKTTSVGLEGT